MGVGVSHRGDTYRVSRLSPPRGALRGRQRVSGHGYRTHWFGLQYDCKAITEGPTVGNGALRTIRWYDGQPVGDGFAQGKFRAFKNVTGDMVDRGVFSPERAVEYLQEKLAEWVTEEQELIVRTNTLTE